MKFYAQENICASKGVVAAKSFAYDARNMLITPSSKIFQVVFSLSLIVLTGAARPAGGKLMVEITGFKNAKGGAAVALYDQNAAKDFPRQPEHAKEARYLPIGKDGKISWEVSDLPFGSYAIILFHDENGDQKLGTNFIGIPKEGLGISNDFKPRFGPPDFDDARFDFIRPDQAVKIRMQY